MSLVVLRMVKGEGEVTGQRCSGPQKAARVLCHGMGLNRQASRLFYGCSYRFTCPAMTVATVILRALDRVRDREI